MHDWWREAGKVGDSPVLDLLISGVGNWVTVPFWGYKGHHVIIAMALTIYHSWLGDVTHGDI